MRLHITTNGAVNDLAVMSDSILELKYFLLLLKYIILSTFFVLSILILI